MSKRGGPCSVGDCTKRAHSSGLCHVHYVAGQPPCSITDCGKPSGMTGGVCPMHYQRHRLHGSYELPARRSDSELFWSRVAESNGCWMWGGSKNNKGYGLFHPYRKPVVLAHRWSYEEMVVEIPEGLVLDHLCRTPLCVNPDHLEPVTQLINIRRARPFRVYKRKAVA